MNPRERRMVIILGAILVLFVGRTAFKTYTGAINTRRNQVASLKQELIKIEKEQQQVLKAKIAWKEAGEQTLSRDLNEAQTALRPEVDRLAVETGLTKVTVQVKGTNRVGKNGIQSLNCGLNAEGKLDGMIRFLFKLHQEPFIVRLNTVRVSQAIGKNVPKDELKLSVDLDTLLLADDREKFAGLPGFKTVDLASGTAEPVQRTLLAEFADYERIVKRKLFSPYEPPVLPGKVIAGRHPANGQRIPINQFQQITWGGAPNARIYNVFFGEQPPDSPVASVPNTMYKPPKVEVGKTYQWRVDALNADGKAQGDLWSFTVVEAVTQAPPPPQPPPPPADQNLVLARVISSPLTQQVVLENPGNQAGEDKRVSLGETLYGGKLVMVHALGAVSEKDNQFRFHALSRPLKDAQPLNWRTQPEVMDALLKLQERSTGISGSPSGPSTEIRQHADVHKDQNRG